VLWHAHALVCPPLLHRPSHSFPHTLSLISAATPTVRTAFRPRLAALPKLCSDPGCRSNPIACRVRRKRQRLPPSLLIENASDRDPAPPLQSAPRRFRSRLATIRKLSTNGLGGHQGIKGDLLEAVEQMTKRLKRVVSAVGIEPTTY
jgi:hypothetical protein